MIRLIPEEDYGMCYELILKSFIDRQRVLGITRENCPGYSAFLRFEKFKVLINKGMVIYGYYDAELCGCIGWLKKSDVRFQIKFLSVSPECRSKGIGRALMRFVESRGQGKIQLGMIYEDDWLFKWYESQGYVMHQLKDYKKGVFRTAFMEKKIENI